MSISFLFLHSQNYQNLVLNDTIKFLKYFFIQILSLKFSMG